MNTTTTKTLTPKKTERIARRLEKALKLGDRIGTLCERRKKLMALSLKDGLSMNEPIRLNDGKLWSLRKPEGKFVRFEEVELKRIPTFKRTSAPVETPSSILNPPSSQEIAS